MTTLTTTEAASMARVSAHTIAAWCRRGLLAAVKHGRRWVIAQSAVARLVCPASDRPRRGEHCPALAGRALRRHTARQLARATARTYRIPVIGHQQRARIAAANAGHHLVRDYLFTIGMDIDDILDYESAAGRKIAEVYRRNHHTEPDNGGIVVLYGRLWRVMRYTDIRDLQAGAAAYARTAHLVTAPAPLALAA